MQLPLSFLVDCDCEIRGLFAPVDPQGAFELERGWYYIQACGSCQVECAEALGESWDDERAAYEYFEEIRLVPDPENPGYSYVTARRGKTPEVRRECAEFDKDYWQYGRGSLLVTPEYGVPFTDLLLTHILAADRYPLKDAAWPAAYSREDVEKMLAKWRAAYPDAASFFNAPRQTSEPLPKGVTGYSDLPSDKLADYSAAEVWAARRYNLGIDWAKDEHDVATLSLIELKTRRAEPFGNEEQRLLNRLMTEPALKEGALSEWATARQQAEKNLRFTQLYGRSYGKTARQHKQSWKQGFFPGELVTDLTPVPTVGKANLYQAIAQEQERLRRQRPLREAISTSEGLPLWKTPLTTDDPRPQAFGPELWHVLSAIADLSGCTLFVDRGGLEYESLPACCRVNLQWSLPSIYEELWVAHRAKVWVDLTSGRVDDLYKVLAGLRDTDRRGPSWSYWQERALTECVCCWSRQACQFWDCPGCGEHVNAIGHPCE